MKRALTLAFVFLATLNLAYAQTPKEAETKSQERAEALRIADAWLDSVQVYQHIPAISAGVVSGDTLIWSKGYGTIDANHSVPATPQTLYSICSISKLFTSVSLMQMYESGKVRLDEPLTTYLPWAKLKPVTDDTVPVTLRGLLTHSSGLPRESDEPYWSGPDYPFPTQDEVRKVIGTQTMLYPSERYFQYSNLGLTLVGETVEAVSGEKYAKYAQTHVLDPLGLKDTHPFLPMDLYGKRLAVGFGAIQRDGTREQLKAFDARGITPAAGYTSTVEDLGKFASWQFRLLRTGKPEILRASTLREMQRVQFMDPNWKTSWGLGFTVVHRDNHTYVGHSGDCPGYHTTLELRPQDELAVIAMETGAEHPGTWADAVFGLLDKRKGYAFKAPAPATGVDLEAFAGHYSSQPWGAEILVLPWASGLAVLQLPNANPAEAMYFLKPKGGDIFRVVREDGSEADEVTFVRDGAGKVTGYKQFSNTRQRIAIPTEPPVKLN